jgi:fluoride exporter
LISWIWVGVSVLGGLGSVARVLVDRAVSRISRSPLPLGTLAVNLTGGAVLGVLAGGSFGPNTVLLLGAGFLGGYTTFSTWMFETERLVREGVPRLAALNLAFPATVGLAATGLGWLVGATLA